jgi:hypothetical protein
LDPLLECGAAEDEIQRLKVELSGKDSMLLSAKRSLARERQRVDSTVQSLQAANAKERDAVMKTAALRRRVRALYAELQAKQVCYPQGSRILTWVAESGWAPAVGVVVALRSPCFFRSCPPHYMVSHHLHGIVLCTGGVACCRVRAASAPTCLVWTVMTRPPARRLAACSTVTLALVLALVLVLVVAVAVAVAAAPPLLAGSPILWARLGPSAAAAARGTPPCPCPCPCLALRPPHPC